MSINISLHQQFVRKIKAYNLNKDTILACLILYYLKSCIIEGICI